jgi:nucleoside-diphosphate-sugar epimerase
MMSPTKHHRMLILGCGYLGSRIAELCGETGWTWDALTRNPDSAAELKNNGCRKTIVSLLADPGWHSLLDPNDYDAIVLCVGASTSDQAGYRASYLDGTKSFLEWADGFTRTCIYTSSISVYGSKPDGWIDEHTPPHPASWRGDIILESEGLIGQMPGGVVLRLGGIYGPGRSGFLTTVFPPGTPRYLNLIHRDDAADAVFKVAQTNAPQPGIYNLTDNSPILREELDRQIKQCFTELGKSPPTLSQTAPKRSQGLTRKIASLRFQQAFNWTPQYPDVRKSLPGLIPSES